MLGAQSGVTDSNMIQYLGIIEQRTNELLAVQSYVNSKVTYSPILNTLLLIMIYFRQKSGERQNVWFSFIIINYTINRNMFVTHINGVGKMSTTHKFVKVMFIFTCIVLNLTMICTLPMYRTKIDMMPSSRCCWVQDQRPASRSTRLSPQPLGRYSPPPCRHVLTHFCFSLTLTWPGRAD